MLFNDSDNGNNNGNQIQQYFSKHLTTTTMKEFRFRLLKASEIECRVGQCGKSQNGVGWCSLLLYKDARCDQKILDETFGMFGWQRVHDVVNGQLCCTVKVLNPDTKEWVSKQDVGVESNTEAVKGQFSDSFKRASFNWGVGRELYTAPKIFITLNQDEMVEKNGKWSVNVKCSFNVAEINYDEERNINALVIVDKKGVIRYKLGETQVQKREMDNDDSDIAELKQYAFPSIEQANDLEALKRIWEDFPQLHDEKDFVDKMTERKSKVA